MWALVWLPIGVAVAVYAVSSPPQPSDFISRPVSFPLFLTVWTVWGGVSGAAFALILKFTERRRSLGQLSLARTTIWGALGAMTVPTALTLLDVLRMQVTPPLYDWRVPLVALVVSGGLGGICGWATLTLARRPTG